MSEGSGPGVRQWPEDFETTTFRGPQQYPEPGEWSLTGVEADGIGWEHPDGYADLLNSFHMNSLSHELSVNGETVFDAAELDEDVLWRTVAKALEQFESGEEIDADPDAVAVEQQQSENAGLGDFE